MTQTQITKDPVLAAHALRNGDVVALPSETVYGLGASIHQEQALCKIFSLKKRPQDNPLIVHALDVAMIEKIAHVTPDFMKVYDAFMPGPITVILDKKIVSDTITREQSTVAVRVPSHPLFREVLQALDHPIAAPSANLSGKPSSTTAEHVYQDFQGQLSLILDGGASECGLESTIVKLEKEQCIILRPGLITEKMLEEVLQRPCIYPTKQIEMVVPGSKYRHYAPHAEVKVIDTIDSIDLTTNAMIMAREPVEHVYYEKLSEDNLYKAFRLADEKQLDVIYILRNSNMSAALQNRLEKACQKT